MKKRTKRYLAYEVKVVASVALFLSLYTILVALVTLEVFA